ncbi:MAG: choice-of-anchor Q domain-containing protein [Bacteroidota bacterium]
MKIRIPLFLVLCWIFALPASAQYTPGQVYFGTNQYVEYRAGNLPIIISAPHGGYLEPTTIPDRTCANCATGRDLYTQELAVLLDSTIYSVFGGHPHVIINRLARIKLDANREIVEAAQGAPPAETAWYEYHDFIQAAKDSNRLAHGTALFLDLHGHGHPIQRIELGYRLTGPELRNSDAILDAQNYEDSSSIRHLANVLHPAVPFSEILRGNDCMGEYLRNRGYPSVPSASDTAPALGDPFFAGGYNTRRHGSQDSSVMNGIQFELNLSGVRDTDANRRDFARALTCAIREYLDRWFFDLDAPDPGNLVSTTADRGAGSLREALLGAAPGDTITFSPALNGDTIRLTAELQLCADITILGPGADQLAISGGDSTRLLRVMPGISVEVRGLSFARGRARGGEDGGAVFAEGNAHFVHCTFTRNHAADDGGAVAITAPSIVMIDSCDVHANTCGGDGGGLRSPSGTMNVNATSITNNFATSQGGGLSNGGTVIIAGCTFARNEAQGNGGAIRSFSGEVTCVNSTFDGNTAAVRGGALSITADLDMFNCTVTNNQASDLGGGLRLISGNTGLYNTLIAFNSSTGSPEVAVSSATLSSLGQNFVRDTSGSGWAPAMGDQLGDAAAPLDPLILALGANGGATATVALQVGSSCIDAGGTLIPQNIDQRGEPRPAGAAPDIGAFEWQLPVAVTEDEVASMRLYPNPAREEITVDFPEAGHYKVVVTNLLGQPVAFGRVEGGRLLRMSVEHLASGTYVLTVQGGLQQQMPFRILRP